MADAAAEKRIVTLRSSSGDEFEVEAVVAMESQTIKAMLVGDRADGVIPLPEVSSRILSMVIEFCTRHVKARRTAAGDEASANDVFDEELKAFNDDFIKVDQSTLFDLIVAANHLKIQGLLDMTCQTAADMIKGKTPEQIRKVFNLRAPTPEEEEEARRVNVWAFE